VLERETHVSTKFRKQSSRRKRKSHLFPPERAVLVAFKPASTVVRAAAGGVPPEMSDLAMVAMPPLAVLIPAAAAALTVGSWILATDLLVEAMSLTMAARAALQAEADWRVSRGPVFWSILRRRGNDPTAVDLSLRFTY
jgi:hypothetical protein